MLRLKFGSQTYDNCGDALVSSTVNKTVVSRNAVVRVWSDGLVHYCGSLFVNFLFTVVHLRHCSCVFCVLWQCQAFVQYILSLIVPSTEFAMMLCCEMPATWCLQVDQTRYV